MDNDIRKTPITKPKKQVSFSNKRQVVIFYPDEDIRLQFIPKKQVRFSKRDIVFHIPNRHELDKTCHLLWYSNEEIQQMQKIALENLRIYIEKHSVINTL